MKQLFSSLLFITAFITTTANAQEDKSKRPSPPAQNTFSLASGAKIKIDYSQPAVKGRTIGKEIAPYGQVWRTGANEATVFETSKDITIEGKTLKAGRYALFTIPNEKEWTIIINKTADQNGAFNYKDADDVLRVTVKPMRSSEFNERMKFSYDEPGNIVLKWGDVAVPFSVK